MNKNTLSTKKLNKDFSILKFEFQFLFILIALNIIFTLTFLRNVEPPIFINGNVKILGFNLIISLIIIFYKYLFSRNLISRNLKKINLYTAFTSIFIPLVLNLSFWSLGPVIVNRSLTVRIIENLKASDKPLRLETINNDLLKNYMLGNFQTNKRLEEQINIGNIKKLKDDSYTLTKKGEFLSKFNNLISIFFNLKNNI